MQAIARHTVHGYCVLLCHHTTRCFNAETASATKAHITDYVASDSSTTSATDTLLKQSLAREH
eukprot:13206-Heterococcus_DN1.PRE.10